MYFFSSDANKKEYLRGNPIVTTTGGGYSVVTSARTIPNHGYRSFVQPEKILKVKDWKKKKDSYSYEKDKLDILNKQLDYLRTQINGTTIGI